jgi:flagellar protein FliO/FliZ
MNLRFSFIGALLAAVAPGVLRAAPTTNAIVPPTVDTGAELLRVVLSLIGVIAMILIAGWLSRRAQARVRPGGRRIRCLETMPVGMKERVMLIDVGGTQLLLGSSPSGLRMLHVLDKPVDDDTSAVSPPARGFRDVLAQWGKPS